MSTSPILLALLDRRLVYVIIFVGWDH